MGLFGKNKKEREKEYMNRLDVPLFLKEDFELIIDDIFTIMGGGYLVIKVRGKLTRCVWNNKLEFVITFHTSWHSLQSLYLLIY